MRSKEKEETESPPLSEDWPARWYQIRLAAEKCKSKETFHSQNLSTEILSQDAPKAKSLFFYKKGLDKTL